MSPPATGAAPMRFSCLFDLRDNPDREWLRRELGIVVEPGGVDDIVARAAASPTPIGLIATDQDSPAPVVAAAPPGTLVLLQLYDERYVAPGLGLSRAPSVTHVFRTFSTDALPLWTYLATAGTAAADLRRASTNARQVAAAVRSGRSVRRASRDYGRLAVPVTTVPIGYTATFTDAFTARFGAVDPAASLFDLVIERPDLVPAEPRDLEISFRGARGQHQRRTGVHLASRLPRSSCAADADEFSGRGDKLDADTYVDLLARTRYALCPPGFTCNESYRVYEALLCGALPTLLTAAVSQGTRAGDDLDDLVRASSWTQALRRVRAQPEPARRAALERARVSAGRAFSRAAASIRTALGAD